jgi:asparagine synthase (glutamine-hydrolysing)
MCGIAGARNDWLAHAGLSPSKAIADSIRSLTWRGPDGMSNMQAGDWWLGCARLAISGPRANQPAALRGGRFAGVMNGAITNARNLWPELRPQTAQRTVLPNDAWLPVLAVSQQRMDLLSSLRGHHAYAVADTETGELVIGQDHYGEKPLHCLIARIDDRWQLVAFASSIAALQQLGMPKPQSDRRLAEWLRYGWSNERPHRFSARLRLDSLPKRGQPFLTRSTASSWHSHAIESTTLQPHPKPATSLKQRLTASVERCMDSPSPAGLFLSGGLDSSCLALAIGSLGASIPAYQFQASGAPSFERQAATEVANKANLALRRIEGGPELLNALPLLTGLCGQPLGDPSILAVYAVARTAAQDGIRIMLGGEGADELLLGYQRYRALARLPRWKLIQRLFSPWSMHKAARYARAVGAHNPIRSLLAVAPPAFGKQVLAPRLAARKCWHDAEEMPDTSRGLALAARADDLRSYLPRDLLPKLDVALMAAGIEGRCPYLEAGIESSGHELSQLGKSALRQAFANELPVSVMKLPKTGFSLPLDDWFRNNTSALDMLSESRSRNREHLRPGGLANLIDRHRSKRSKLGHAIYLLLAYEHYLRSNE